MERLKQTNPEMIAAIVLWIAGIIIAILDAQDIWSPDYSEQLEFIMYLGAGLFGIYSIFIKWRQSKQHHE